MTVSDFKRLFEYEFWANQTVAEKLNPTNAPALRLLCHVLASERLWLDRLTGSPQSLPVWPEMSLGECRTLLSQLQSDWKTYLDGLSDEMLDTSFAYVNSKGEPWRSTISDTLTHLITHSCYHRGQIAQRIRLAGEDPPYTDFIHVTRGGLLN